INPFLFELTKIQIEEIAEAGITDRLDGDALFITDNGNYIADCRFKSIPDISSLHSKLINVPGVIETGIFDHYINQIVSFKETDLTVYKNYSRDGSARLLFLTTFNLLNIRNKFCKFFRFSVQ